MIYFCCDLKMLVVVVIVIVVVVVVLKQLVNEQRCKREHSHNHAPGYCIAEYIEYHHAPKSRVCILHVRTFF